MHPLEKKTRAIIHREQLVRLGDTVLVGVSAGPDSMTLLHVMAKLAHDMQLNLHAAYVNHGLRPEETIREEELVRDQVGKLGITGHVGRVDVRTFAKQKKLSTEHAARLLRYEFLEKTGVEINAQRIALAHTSDDQAEEILLRLIRGTGRTGLSGMRMLRDNKIVRPFLGVSKKTLLDYLTQYNIPHLTDSSNTDQSFLRNRIRLALMPFLAEHFNPNIGQTLVQTAEILQDEEKLLAELTHTACASIFIDPPPTTPAGGAKAPASLTLDLKRFAEQAKAIQRRIIEAACWRMACEPGARQISQILAIAASERNDSGLHLTEGLRVKKTVNELIFSYPKGRVAERGNLQNQAEPQTAFQLNIPEPGTYHIPEIGGQLVIDCRLKAPPLPKPAEDPYDYLDLSLLSFPLSLRSPQPGDIFHPLGGPGHKKVGDFLKDMKMAKTERSTVPVLLAAEKIIALPGLRIDNSFRITAQTTRTLAIHWIATK